MRVVWFALAGALVGCSQVLGISNWHDVGDPMTDGGHPSDGSPSLDVFVDDAGVLACPSPRDGGTSGVLVKNEFCIDSVEAPVGLYDDFFSNSDPKTGQDPECAWNATFKPPYEPFSKSDPDYLNKPRTTVDWCDAVAYCRYWGKHLCGNRVDGGAVSPSAQDNAGQWYTACTNNTSRQFPYGNAYDPKACNSDQDRPDGGTYTGIAVSPTKSTCQGGVPGLYDMSGNVTEWENSCDDPADASTRCRARGGTFWFKQDSNCAPNAGDESVRNDSTNPWVGIRCCWSP